MRRFLPWLTAISLIACGVLAYRYTRERRNGALFRAESFAAEKQSHRQIAELNEKLAAASGAAQKTRDGLSAEKPAAAKAIVYLSDIARDFPEYAVLQQKQARRRVMAEWGDGLTNLNLTADQLGQLKNLLVERIMSDTDAASAAREAGLLPGSAASNEAIKQASDAVEKQIVDLIGADGKAKLDEGQGVTVFKQQVAFMYQTDFTDAGVPMTSDQSFGLAQLLSVMAKNRPTGEIPDPATGLTSYDEQLLTQAAPILSAAQLEILKNDQIDQHRSGVLMSQYMHLHNQGSASIEP